MVKLNRIYTRTGDDGTTRLADSSRLAKSSARIEAIGAVDEANSALGLLAVSLAGHSARKAVASIQNDMFDLGADLATPGQNFEPSDMVLRIVPDQVTALEHAIDGLNVELPPLSSFVLPGGSEQAARAHVARAAVRRAERAMVALGLAEPLNPAGLAYINRLSDYLFVLARALNAAQGGDVLWEPGANRRAR
ncbi:MAG TPA: cob(I)yrinic acid a,c-diamide adenosyltransferase [Sphingomonadaceae bacterium]